MNIIKPMRFQYVTIANRTGYPLMIFSRTLLGRSSLNHDISTLMNLDTKFTKFLLKKIYTPKFKCVSSFGFQEFSYVKFNIIPVIANNLFL